MGNKVLFGFNFHSSWASWVRISRNRPLLRNTVYGALVSLVVYALIFTTFPSKAPSIFPNYSRPSAQDVLPATWKARAGQVKAAFRHAFRGYQEHAAPADELKPLSNTPINKYCRLVLFCLYYLHSDLIGLNSFNGWGVTAFDSLDTMLLMGLEEEYQQAMKTVGKANFSKSEVSAVSNPMILLF